MHTDYLLSLWGLSIDIFKGAVCKNVCELVVEIGTAVQIQVMGDCCLPRPLLLRLDPHAGCQFKVTQQERVQLTMEAEETYS